VPQRSQFCIDTTVRHLKDNNAVVACRRVNPDIGKPPVFCEQAELIGLRVCRYLGILRIGHPNGANVHRDVIIRLKQRGKVAG
jgi:hypothetical protein